MTLIADKVEIQIPIKIIKQLFKVRQVGKRRESGGIVIARKQVGCLRYEITMISKPTNRDFASRYMFIRDGEHAQKIINRRNLVSKGKENYFGEWHTHPEKTPRYSKTDLTLLMKVKTDGTCKFGNPVMIIVGFDSFCLLFFNESEEIQTLYISFQNIVA